MKRFTIMYCSPVERFPATYSGTSETVSFDTIDEAKRYIDAQLEGEQPFCHRDTNPGNGVHWFEVVDEDSFTVEDGYGDPVYASNWYYNK